MTTPNSPIRLKLEKTRKVRVATVVEREYDIPAEAFDNKEDLWAEIKYRNPTFTLARGQTIVGLDGKEIVAYRQIKPHSRIWQVVVLLAVAVLAYDIVTAMIGITR